MMTDRAILPPRTQSLLQGAARMRADEVKRTFEEEQRKNILLECTSVKVVEVELMEKLSRLEEMQLARVDPNKRPFDANAYSVNVLGFTGERTVARVICPFDGKNLLLLLKGCAPISYHPILYQVCARDMARLIIERHILPGTSPQRSNGGPSIRGH